MIKLSINYNGVLVQVEGESDQIVEIISGLNELAARIEKAILEKAIAISRVAGASGKKGA